VLQSVKLLCVQPLAQAKKGKLLPTRLQVIEAGEMDEKKQAKRSFWRFGGRLHRMYNWLVGLFFVLSCFVQINRYGSHYLPEALGAAVGQTFVLAVVLFVVFKVISR
jgi:hypothetical protein